MEFANLIDVLKLECPRTPVREIGVFVVHLKKAGAVAGEALAEAYESWAQKRTVRSLPLPAEFMAYYKPADTRRLGDTGAATDDECAKWKEIKAELLTELGESAYSWISPLLLTAASENSVTLASSTHFLGDWVRKHYVKILSKKWGRDVVVVDGYPTNPWSAAA